MTLCRSDGELFRWPAAHNGLWLKASGSKEAGYQLEFAAGLTVLVGANGREITVTKSDSLDEGVFEELLLNQVNPLVATLSGQLTLHGSAIELGESTISFLAPSGYGKSTLAAAFTIAGHRFLTDDTLGVDFVESSAWARVGAPFIRLNDDSADLLQASRVRDMQMGQDDDRKQRFVDSSSRFHCKVVRPMKAIYFLRNDGALNVTITREQGFRVIGELVRNSFLLDVDEPESMRRHFQQLTNLAEIVPTFGLDYPRAYERLPDVVAEVVTHARSL